LINLRLLVEVRRTDLAATKVSAETQVQQK